MPSLAHVRSLVRRTALARLLDGRVAKAEPYGKPWYLTAQRRGVITTNSAAAEQTSASEEGTVNEQRRQQQHAKDIPVTEARERARKYVKWFTVGLGFAGVYLFYHNIKTAREAKQNARKEMLALQLPHGAARLTSHSPSEPTAALPILPGKRLPQFSMTDHKGEAKTKGDLLANDAFPLMYMGDPSNSKDVADQLKAIAQAFNDAYNVAGFLILQPVIVVEAPPDDLKRVMEATGAEGSGGGTEVLCLCGEDAGKLADAPRGYGSEASPGSGALDKPVDLDQAVILVNPDGLIVAAFKADEEPDKTANGVAQQVAMWQEEHPEWKAQPADQKDGGQKGGGKDKGSGKK